MLTVFLLYLQLSWGCVPSCDRAERIIGQYCSPNSIQHCSDPSEKGELNNIGHENLKFLESSLSCYEEAARKCDQVKGSGASCMMTAMRSPQCSPGQVNRLYQIGKRAYSVRKAMDETIGRLKETIDQNEQYVSLRDEEQRSRRYANYKYDSRLADPWDLKKSVINLFPEMVSKTFRRLFSQGRQSSRQSMESDSFMSPSGDIQQGAMATGSTSSPRETGAPTGVGAQESAYREGGDGSRSKTDGFGEPSAAEDANMITLEVHNRMKQKADGQDQSKLSELDSKYGTENPYRRRLEHVGGLQGEKSTEAADVIGDPSITSARGPTLFEKVRRRYNSLFPR